MDLAILILLLNKISLLGGEIVKLCQSIHLLIPSNIQICFVLINIYKGLLVTLGI